MAARKKSAGSKRPPATKAARASPAAPGQFASSITGFELVDPQTIKRNPLNFRRHPESQRAAMRATLRKVGYVQAVIVNQRNRHLVDGEMRLDLALENAEQTVPVVWVDLDPEQEKLALTTMNPIGELAVIDPEQLGKLLSAQRIEVDGLQDLIETLEDLAAEASVKAESKAQGKSARNIQTTHTIKAVVAVDDVATFERAIALTGTMNRGEALQIIARHYIEARTNGRAAAEGQHDARAEGRAPAELAQALAAGARRT